MVKNKTEKKKGKWLKQLRMLKLGEGRDEVMSDAESE